jgi:hypothetical protein
LFSDKTALKANIPNSKERQKMKTLKFLNPTTWFQTAIDDPTDASGNTASTSTAMTSANQSTEVASNGPETTIVAGTFVPNGADRLFTESAKQTEHFAKVVEQFDEDKQDPIEWVIWKIAAIFCYIAPFALAIPIGLSIGDVFTTALPGQPVSPLMQTWSANIAIHMLSLFLEILMPILGLTTVLAFKKALKSRKAVAGFVVVGLFFLTISAGNAMALFFLLDKGGHLGTDMIATVVTLGRSFGPLILDIGASITLSVYAKKSLEKYLADQQRKIEAIRRVNDIHVAMETTKIKTAMDREQAIMDMHTKKQRADTWNELERIQSQAMIDQARKNMEGGSDGYRRSRY